MASPLEPVTALSITLTVIQGDQLVAKDRNLLGQWTTSDPYVLVSLFPQGFGGPELKLGRSETIRFTLCPRWGEKFMLEVPQHALTAEALFEITIMDWDDDLVLGMVQSEDDLMGVVPVPFPPSCYQPNAPTPITEKWYGVPLMSASRASGRIQCSIEVLKYEKPLGAILPPTPKVPSGVPQLGQGTNPNKLDKKEKKELKKEKKLMKKEKKKEKKEAKKEMKAIKKELKQDKKESRRGGLTRAQSTSVLQDMSAQSKTVAATGTLEVSAEKSKSKRGMLGKIGKSMSVRGLGRRNGSDPDIMSRDKSDPGVIIPQLSSEFDATGARIGGSKDETNDRKEQLTKVLSHRSLNSKDSEYDDDDDNGGKRSSMGSSSRANGAYGRRVSLRSRRTSASHHSKRSSGNGMGNSSRTNSTRSRTLSRQLSCEAPNSAKGRSLIRQLSEEKSPEEEEEEVSRKSLESASPPRRELGRRQHSMKMSLTQEAPKRELGRRQQSMKLQSSTRMSSRNLTKNKSVDKLEDDDNKNLQKSPKGRKPSRQMLERASSARNFRQEHSRKTPSRQSSLKMSREEEKKHRRPMPVKAQSVRGLRTGGLKGNSLLGGDGDDDDDESERLFGKDTKPKSPTRVMSLGKPSRTPQSPVSPGEAMEDETPHLPARSLSIEEDPVPVPVRPRRNKRCSADGADSVPAAPVPTVKSPKDTQGLDETSSSDASSSSGSSDTSTEDEGRITAATTPMSSSPIPTAITKLDTIPRNNSAPTLNTQAEDRDEEPGFYLDADGEEYYLDENGIEYYKDSIDGGYYELDPTNSQVQRESAAGFYMDAEGQEYYLDEDGVEYYKDPNDGEYYADDQQTVEAGKQLTN